MRCSARPERSGCNPRVPRSKSLRVGRSSMEDGMMLARHFLAVIVLLTVWSSSVAGIVTRAEITELRRADGTAVTRVERDKDGNVVQLLLNDMQLSSDEVVELGSLVHLRRLGLFQTNFQDGDLQHLNRCRSLKSLNLTSTEVTDAAVQALLELDKLEYLCLGNVNVTPNAILKLKDCANARGQDLKLGYSQRKR
jgi:hypothetical protein